MKLSILMVTYNHAKYIAQALDSVLMQEVNIEYEIVLGEDCSTDNTRAILLEYKKRHPDKIRLLLHQTNVGAHDNFIATYKACRGEYIAYLEGDDYWTSPGKLQKQVDFLDAHPECSICFHNSEEFYEDGSKPSWLYCSKDQKEISKLEDLIEKCNFIPSCSVLFRNGLFGDFPDWYSTLGMGDWILHLLNAQHGDIGYINEVMGRHRHHSSGTWSFRSQAKNILEIITAYETINKYLNLKYNDLISKKIAEYNFSLFRIAINNGELVTALKHLISSLGLIPASIKIKLKKVPYRSKFIGNKLRN
jgi:glycosyltransferase involved in cell wall biosynthesis